MRRALTKDQQWKTVVQGLALGCLALGTGEISGSKMSLQFAFSSAWRSWSRSTAFPSISPDDFYIYATKSSRRNGSYAAWEWGTKLVPYLSISGWDEKESLEAFAADEPVGPEEWTDLARLYLAAVR